MKNLKLSLLAVSFIATAGVVTAGSIYVDNVQKFTFSGSITITPNGDVLVSNGNPVGEENQEPPPETTPTDECPSDPNDNTAPCGDSGGGITPPPGSCAGVGLAESSWSRTGGGIDFSNFPMTAGLRHEFTVGKFQVLTIPFTAPANGKGQIAFDGHPTQTHAQMTVAMSKCPADFAAQLANGALCVREGAAQSYYWTVENDGSQFYSCQLIPGQRYYMNIVYATNLTGSFVPTCPSSRCGAIFTFYNY